MSDIITTWIMGIFKSVNSLGGAVISTPDSYNPTIYKGIMTIQENVIMPVALIVLAIFLLLELYNITTRTDMMGSNSFEIPFRCMFKFAICKLALESTHLILTAMFEVSQDLIMGIDKILTGSNGIDYEGSRQIIYELVDKAGFFEQILMSGAILVIWILTMVIALVVDAIVIGRMIEMYVYIGIAPLPLATFPNAEQSQIAKGFLKSFMAVCIQGVLIFITIGILRILFNNIVDIGSISSNESLQEMLWKCAGYAIILLIAILNTGRWSKSICNAI